MTLYDEILNSIAEKENGLYTGALRFGFQGGRLSSYVEANRPSDKVSRLSKEDLLKRIRSLCSPWHNGSVTLMFKNGVVTRGCYSCTWQAGTLDRLRARWRCKSVVNAESQ